ncbi:TraR/DksA C4-type zinc finger protein [Streptomyces sp. NPDC049936]|uniref:TraR/DksA C4-type zinc finger protein n=1 Tax=Streptomyces sp. NPDC049936 TaxID=3365599 RepID=UPI00378982C1
MSPDAPRPEPSPRRTTADEARLRLDHARTSRLTQLRALGENGWTDDLSTASQQSAIEDVLKEIDEAFARVEAGTYGSCTGCGRPVAEERLEILPYTRYCVACRRRAAVAG